MWLVLAGVVGVVFLHNITTPKTRMLMTAKSTVHTPIPTKTLICTNVRWSGSSFSIVLLLCIPLPATMTEDDETTVARLLSTLLEIWIEDNGNKLAILVL